MDLAAKTPADLTITVGAGTTVADLDAVLAEHGQECPLDPRDAGATVGGVLSAGLTSTALGRAVARRERSSNHFLGRP